MDELIEQIITNVIAVGNMYNRYAWHYLSETVARDIIKAALQELASRLTSHPLDQPPEGWTQIEDHYSPEMPANGTGKWYKSLDNLGKDSQWTQ